MLFSILVDCQKLGVRSVADHAILRLGCLQEKWKNGRLQPKFAVSVRRPDVDMRRLASLVGVEMKTERSDAQNGRHLSTIPHATWIAWKYFFAERQAHPRLSGTRG